MSRPKSATVDYFTHDCKPDEDLIIIEHRFGNDGYTVWYKLREALGLAPGHFVDANDPRAWNKLISRCRVTPDIGSEILDLMAELYAIDPELWRQSRVIWCQNFVDSLSELYKKRTVGLPQKPDSRSFRRGNLPKPQDGVVSGADTAETPQSKGKESIVKETHTKDFACVVSENPTPEPAIPDEHCFYPETEKPNPDPSGAVTPKSMTVIVEHSFLEFRSAYLAVLPDGIFPDEAECRAEFSRAYANANQIVRGAKVFISTDAARRGIGVYKPITFLRKKKWCDFQPRGQPLGVASATGDHSWKKQQDEWQRENEEYVRKVA